MQTESLGHDDIQLLFFMIIIIALADGPPQRGPTQLINTKYREPYYTKPV